MLTRHHRQKQLEEQQQEQELEEYNQHLLKLTKDFVKLSKATTSLEESDPEDAVRALCGMERKKELSSKEKLLEQILATMDNNNDSDDDDGGGQKDEEEEDDEQEQEGEENRMRRKKKKTADSPTREKEILEYDQLGRKIGPNRKTKARNLYSRDAHRVALLSALEESDMFGKVFRKRNAKMSDSFRLPLIPGSEQKSVLFDKEVKRMRQQEEMKRNQRDPTATTRPTTSGGRVNSNLPVVEDVQTASQKRTEKIFPSLLHTDGCQEKEVYYYSQNQSSSGLSFSSGLRGNSSHIQNVVVTPPVSEQYSSSSSSSSSSIKKIPFWTASRGPSSSSYSYSASSSSSASSRPQSTATTARTTARRTTTMIMEGEQQQKEHGEYSSYLLDEQQSPQREPQERTKDKKLSVKTDPSGERKLSKTFVSHAFPLASPNSPLSKSTHFWPPPKPVEPVFTTIIHPRLRIASERQKRILFMRDKNANEVPKCLEDAMKRAIVLGTRKLQQEAVVRQEQEEKEERRRREQKRREERIKREMRMRVLLGNQGVK